jgi:hypothetical protein
LHFSGRPTDLLLVMVVSPLSWNAATISLLTVDCVAVALALLIWLVLAIRRHKKVAPDNTREKARRPPDTISVEGELPRFVPRPKPVAWADDTIDAARAPFAQQGQQSELPPLPRQPSKQHRPSMAASHPTALPEIHGPPQQPQRTKL